MKFKLSVLGVLFISLQMANAQGNKDSVMRFSLAEAQDYALKNSPVVKNSNLDLSAARKKIWETTAIGLPQVNGKLTYGYTLEQSSLLNQINGLNQIGILPSMQQLTNIRIDSLVNPSSYDATKVTKINNYIDSIRNLPPGDLKNSVSLDLTVSQIIFSGAYFVGLQTATIYRGLSELAITKSEQDLKESVSDAYYLILITRENKSIIDSTYKNTANVVNDIVAQYQQGFVEETFVDQMKINLANLKNASDMLSRTLDIVIKLFNFQLGLDINSKTELTDSISSLVSKIDYSLVLNKTYDVEASTDYKLLKTQERLQEMNLKLQKTNLMPTVAAYYAYHKQLNKDYPDFQPPQIIGITASMPIFTSGQNIVKISQARIQLNKTRNSNWQATQGLKIDYERTRSQYLSAIDKYNTQKQNLLLAQRIYNLSLIKLKNGVISSSDMLQVQNQLLQTQSDYFSSISELSTNKAKLEKLLTAIQ